MNLEHAKAEFEKYLDDYDRKDEKVNLKIVHTYGVVDCCSDIARRMGLSQEDRELAELIGLLHDIGRFEQLKRFDSFLPGTMDHARYGGRILFEEGMIRRFIEEDTFDDIIRTAIDCHSDFKLEGISDERTLLHAKLIRDADKLDNCRVKLEEDVAILTGASAEETGRTTVSDAVWEACLRGESVYSPDRKTPIDFWVSYLAYFYNLYFPETMEIVFEEDYINKIVDVIPCSNPDTADKMCKLRDMIRQFGEKMISEGKSHKNGV